MKLEKQKTPTVQSAKFNADSAFSKCPKHTYFLLMIPWSFKLSSNPLYRKISCHYGLVYSIDLYYCTYHILLYQLLLILIFVQVIEQLLGVHSLLPPRKVQKSNSSHQA